MHEYNLVFLGLPKILDIFALFPVNFKLDDLYCVFLVFFVRNGKKVSFMVSLFLQGFVDLIVSFGF